jgi:hypothetical protein
VGREDPVFPNYDESILAIPNSILKACGVEAFHKTLPLLDEALKRHSKIVLVIFDGLGSAVLENLAPHSYLSKNKKRDLTSVYPSTTTAALTSLYSGLSPIEHGWLGWTCWFKEVNQSVDLFPNTIYGTKNQASTEHLGSKFMPYKLVTDLVPGSVLISPFAKVKASESAEMLGVAERFLNREESRLAICYNTNPDETMHKKGCYHPTVSEIVRRFSMEVEQFAARVKDALIIVTADHGHKNVTGCVIDDYPEIMECLYRPYTLESRAASLFVKPEFMPVFEERWKLVFGDAFLLLTRQEVLERNLFGEGKPHEKGLEFIGDYIACALSELTLDRRIEVHNFASAHAGLTKEEMLVPLVMIET